MNFIKNHINWYRLSKHFFGIVLVYFLITYITMPTDIFTAQLGSFGLGVVIYLMIIGFIKWIRTE